jgi:hypothetical protein
MSLRNLILDRLSGGEYGGAIRELREAAAVLSEAAANWAVERAKEDAAWRNLTVDGTKVAAPIDRSVMIPLARRAFLTDPFLKCGIWTMTRFAFGAGIDGPRAARAKDQTVEEARQAVQPLTDFWNEASNQAALFSVPRQYQRSNQLLIDGDLFLALFVAADKTVRVRRVGSLLVKDILFDPDDAERPLYYVIEEKQRRFDRTRSSGDWWVEAPLGNYTFRRDYANTDPSLDPLAGQIDAPDDIYMMHVAIDCIDETGFGHSALMASLPWSIAAKNIAEDQATISRATAALMNRLQVQGNAQAVETLKQALQSTSDSSSPQPPLTASLNLMTPGMDLKVDRASTNAGDAWQNSRLMRIASAAGMGLALHYLADPENANLATSRSMELPILRHLEAYQSLWLWVYRSLFGFVMQQRGIAAEDVAYDIPALRMVEPDIASVGKAIMDGYDAGLLTKEQAAQRLLELLSFDDIPARLEELLNEEKDEDETKTAKLEAVLSGPSQEQAPATAPEVGAGSAARPSLETF